MSVSLRHDPFPVAKAYRGIYAHGVEASSSSRMLHISGQIGIDQNGELDESFDGQCRQAIRNVEAVLQSASMNLSDIVKVSFFLVRREDMDGLVQIRKELLTDIRPAITTVFVAGLVSPDWLIEVEAFACAEELGQPPRVRQLLSPI